MDIFHSLPEDIFKDQQTNLVSGSWVLIQFSPNPSTREVFNIGVIFKERRKPISFKVLDNADNFEAMYGSQGKENFTFLIHVLSEMLQNNIQEKIVDIDTPSPQISFTKPKPVQGVSADFIIESLFQRMVPLAWNAKPTAQARVYNSINSIKLKEAIKQRIKKSFPGLLRSLFTDNPILIPDPNHQIYIDLPIYVGQESITRGDQIAYADITSMAQKSEVYRQLDLLKSRENLLMAKEHLNIEGNGKLYIFTRDDGLDRSERLQIRNEIEETTWRLNKAGIEYTLHSDIGELTDSILGIAA